MTKILIFELELEEEIPENVKNQEIVFAAFASALEKNWKKNTGKKAKVKVYLKQDDGPKQ